MPVSEPGISPMLADEDDAPPWSDEAFGRAELRDGGVLVRAAHGTLTRSDPPAVERQVTLHLDARMLEHFRANEPGWEERINAALRQVSQT
jgi:uncharacterized protein (DUF4415 family)